MPIEIVPPGTNYDFIGRWKYCVLGSSLVILISLAMVPVLGIRWGIDFAGGTEVQVGFSNKTHVGEGAIRGVVRGTGVGDATVVRYGAAGKNDFLIRFRGGSAKNEKGESKTVDKIQAALAQKIAPVTLEGVQYVGPRVGAELRRDGLLALGVACLLILAYIAFRFSSRFAPGAVIALVHDVTITSGVFVMLRQEFNLQVLAALLAILGYSLNDTIIVYDRIRENMALRTSYDLADVLNQSVNQTLSRTLLTSGTTLLAVIALLLVGGAVIRPFALAMAIGIFVGTYSSIYIASPTLLLLERRYVRRHAAKAGAKGAGKGGKARRQAERAASRRRAESSKA